MHRDEFSLRFHEEQGGCVFPCHGRSNEPILTAIITSIYSAREEEMMGCEALVDDISKNSHFKQVR